MNPRTRQALVLAGVFALGGIAGGAGMRAWVFQELRATMDRPPVEARARFRMEAMRRKLDLTDEQVVEVAAIVRESEAQRERAVDPCRADLEALRTATDARILDVLTPEQRVRFAELNERRRKRGGRPPPPP